MLTSGLPSDKDKSAQLSIGLADDKAPIGVGRGLPDLARGARTPRARWLRRAQNGDGEEVLRGDKASVGIECIDILGSA